MPAFTSYLTTSHRFGDGHPRSNATQEAGACPCAWGQIQHQTSGTQEAQVTTVTLSLITPGLALAIVRLYQVMLLGRV